MRLRIPAVYMRGGTSKAVFFHKKHLPKDLQARDRIILAAYGSPDPYNCQIDGMGGAVSTASKVAIISPSQNPDYDIDYLFGQVAIDKPLVSYRGNCGNISAAVAPFAIEEGLALIKEPVTSLRIWQVNTGKLIVAEIPVNDGRYDEDGDFAIDGVPGTGGKISLHFMQPGGAVSGALLPTGNIKDTLAAGFGKINISIVDAGNPVVFVRAADLGLTGTEIDEIEACVEIKQKLEAIRSRAAVLMGLVASPQKASEECQDIPKIALVSAKRGYKTCSGRVVQKGEIDIVVRMMSMGSLHRSCAVTGAICTAGAAKIDGTVVSELFSGSANVQEIRIGHPGGVMPVGVNILQGDAGYDYQEAIIHRTARRLMDGHVYVKGGEF